ncbi:hypothetical protein J6590_086534 [Homalodisca vitripennis]|nr:hypothetical protein J6590_086534 [Homalodisca vitripennis]
MEVRGNSQGYCQPRPDSLIIPYIVMTSYVPSNYDVMDPQSGAAACWQVTDLYDQTFRIIAACEVRVEWGTIFSLIQHTTEVG